jgi:hypothetical protein
VKPMFAVCTGYFGRAWKLQASLWPRYRVWMFPHSGSLDSHVRAVRIRFLPILRDQDRHRWPASQSYFRVLIVFSRILMQHKTFCA